MDGLTWSDHPVLRRPLLVAAFEGWNDAADAATDAVDWLVNRFDAEPFAELDPDEYIDYQARRPETELVDGITRRITWPSLQFSAARSRTTDRDLVILSAVEPNYRWRNFTHAILEVATQTGCEMVVSFGALLAEVPHTRPVHVTGTTTDPALITTLELEQSRYEGPTGIVGVLHDACERAGIPSVSLWAPVPHYVATPPDPVATRALLERFAVLTGTPLDLTDLNALVAEWREQVTEAVAADDEVREYVVQLETRADEEAATGWSRAAPPSFGESDLPSGDAIAAEVERYLRDNPGLP